MDLKKHQVLGGGEGVVRAVIALILGGGVTAGE